MNMKRLFLFTVLVSVLHVNFSFSSKQKTKEDEKEIELVSKNKKIKMKQEIAVAQSGFLKNALEKQESDQETPSIPLPNVRAKDLKDIVHLLEKADEYNDKEKLVEFINKKRRAWIRPFGWNLNKLMNLLEAANYLDAQLVLSAFACEISKQKITKKNLATFSTDIFWQIIVQHIVRINSYCYTDIMNIFEEGVVDDLKDIEEGKFKNEIKEGLKNNKMKIPYYMEVAEKVDFVGVSSPYSIFKSVKKVSTPYLISGDNSGIMKIWDLSKPEGKECIKTLKDQTEKVHSVVFSPNGKSIAYGDAKGAIKILDFTKKKGEGCIKNLIGHQEEVNSFVFSNNGKRIISGDNDGIIKIWDITKKNNEECVKTFEKYGKFITSVVLNPVDGTFAYCSGNSSDKAIKIWDIKREKQIKSLFHDLLLPLSIAFSPNGEKIALGGQAGELKIWDLNKKNSKECMKVLNGHKGWVNSVVFSPDGRCLISGGEDGTIKIWSINTGICVKKTFDDHNDSVSSIALSLVDNIFVSGSFDKTIKIWDLSKPEGQECIKTLFGHEGKIVSVALSPMRLEEKF